MSEVASRPAASRGRGSGRGGRGGFAGRGGRRTNGDKVDPKSAAESSSGAFNDDDDIAELRKQYGDKTSVLREMFPAFSEVDILWALQETDGDENAAVTRMAEGTMPQWDEVSKTKKPTKTKDTTTSSAPNESATAGSRHGRGGRAASEGGRGRGRASERGGRGGRGRSAQPAANGTRTKETPQLSVPTEESPAWDTENPKATITELQASPLETSTAPQAAAQAKTWASMLRQSTVPKPAPKPKEAPAVHSAEPVELPVTESAQIEAAAQKDEITPIPDIAIPVQPPVAEPEIALPPSRDELTKSNLEQVVDESQPPTTATAASTAADSWDPRQNPISAAVTPLSAAQQQHQAQRSNVSGYAATAAKATAARTPVYQRRVLDQEEAVRMPGNREVDRAAVQFGAFSLGGGDEDVDGEREEAETRAQPPADSPVAQPRATLPPAAQPSAVPESYQQKSSAAGTPGGPPGSTSSFGDLFIAGETNAVPVPSATAPGVAVTGLNQTAHPPAALAQQYGRFGQVAPQDVGAGQKGLDPFSQQTAASQPPFDNFPSQTSQAQAQQPTGAFSSAPTDYSSYYTASQHERNPYNYYGQQFGQQQQQQGGQHDALASQQRSAGGYSAAQSDNLSQYPQSGSMYSQPRFGAAANDSQNSGHSTPNPTAQSSQPGQQQQGQQQPQQQQPAGGAPGSQPQSHGGQYPGYGHPYYSNPYYHQYYSGYGQGGFSPYGKGGGMYGQPYGVSPNGPYDHASSPGSFGGQSSLHRDSGLGSGLGEYGRGGSGQAGSQPGLGASSFGSAHDNFARGGSSYQSQGQQFGSQGQPGAGSANDDLKPFGEAKTASGPSPSLGGARPGSAANNAPAGQSGLPPPQNSQMSGGYSGYPNHLQGHGGLHGSSGYGMGGAGGGGGGGGAGGQHGNTPYGSYGQGFSSGGYYGAGQQQQPQQQQQQQQRGGWGGNYH